MANIIKAPSYLVTSGQIDGIANVCHILNIYAPQDISAKQALWDDISGLLNNLNGLWILLGDFNAVRSPEERCNSRFNDSCALSINSFIHQHGIQEYTMHGSLFTYVKDNGSKKSKIDRVLVSTSFMNTWPTAALTTLPHSFSDHLPLILTTTTQDFGPIPFKFFNSWRSKPGLEKIVYSSLETSPFFGRQDQILNAKFKTLKRNLREWLPSNSSLRNQQSISLNNQLASLDAIIDYRDYTEDESGQWIETKEKLLEIEHAKTADLQQKLRAKD